MENNKRKPCRECKAAKTKYNEYEIYTEEEIKEIFMLLDEHAPLRNRVMIKFAFTGGFRRGELLAIDETDLFFDTNEVRIDESLQYTKKKGYRFKDPKSNSFRKVTMPPDVMQEAAILLRRSRRINYCWVNCGEEQISFCYLVGIWDNRSIQPHLIPGGRDSLRGTTSSQDVFMI
ncbi:tyrosine-type recombinase/integrase [Bacillus subtilis]|uniref:tyrosine-type recombinase/integrase n=1 Tax=Bacillus subtilis TaxID=1423 RepID=UPI0031F4F2E7